MSRNLAVRDANLNHIPVNSGWRSISSTYPIPSRSKILINPQQNRRRARAFTKAYATPGTVQRLPSEAGNVPIATPAG
ncbi:hypothetical protein KCP74_11810 [Salmonella enterica subsp. enterica]|nr:hypothetical protein KCP74_11810 [Salmonella enterica subsp. enterica]